MPYKDPNDPRKLEAQRNHYAKHKDKVKAAVSRRRSTIREEWHEFKRTLKCAKCSQKHPATLDFHHLDPTKKDGIISKLVSNGCFALAKKEIKKCIVLCANCHRIHHWEERKAKKLAKKAAKKAARKK